MSWKSALIRTVKTTSGETFKTLGDARDFILAQPERNEWHNAAGKLMAAAESGDRDDLEADAGAGERAVH